MQPLSPSQKQLLTSATTTYQQQVGHSLKEYLYARGFSDETITRSRLGQVKEPYAGHEYLRGRLVIPYLGPNENVTNLRFRCLEHQDCKAEGCDSKYMSLSGYPARIYNVRALVSAGTTIEVTEGELDAVTLEQCGLHAVAIPGVENMPSYFSRMVAGFETVRLWADGDKAGRELIARFLKVVPWATAIRLPEGEDVNSILVAKGRAGLLAMLDDQ